MIMAVKHQILMSQNPRHLIMVTLNHLDAMTDYATSPNTKKNIHKYDPKWGKQERLDYAAILARSNVISDICAYLESLLNKTQANWSRPCMNTFLVDPHKFIFLIIYV